MTPSERPSPSEIRTYIDQFAKQIYVRVKLGDDEGWQDLTIDDLHSRDPHEAMRVEQRIIERGAFPSRVLIV